MGCLGILRERARRDLAWKPTGSVPALSVLQLLLPSDLKDSRERYDLVPTGIGSEPRGGRFSHLIVCSAPLWGLTDVEFAC